MRVISGKYKGKKIDGYDIDGTRPTQDRVKESLFAMIQEEILESTVLDLFAGTGNLGIEALSNGAQFAYFVDNNPKCCEIIQRNLSSIPQNTYQIENKDYEQVLHDWNQKQISFDIIFLDPPYSLNCFPKILEILDSSPLLKEGGIVVCEYENEQFQEEYANLKLEKEKKYGYKKIKIYRKKEKK